MLTLHAFLSSPGDVTDERALARSFIERLQSERAHRDRLQLRVVAWDKPGAGTAMPAHLEPQEALEQSLRKPSDCDIVIVIFGYRMGTPLSAKHLKPNGDPFWSGTEHEYLDAMKEPAPGKKRPVVLVYRKQGAPDVNAADPERKEKLEQWDRVEAFFSGFKNPDGSFRGFYKYYKTPSHFEDQLDQDLRELVATWLANSTAAEARLLVTREPPWRGLPFPGMRAFTEKDAPIFFGRARETDELVRRLADESNRFLAVIGASGAGKSSLVAAGLLPRLINNAIPGSEAWLWVRFTPGGARGDPIRALAEALAQRGGRLASELESKLEPAPEILAELVSEMVGDRPAWAELMVFIDQFEELFTLVDDSRRERFIDLVAAMAQTKRIRTVVTLRADFYSRCVESPTRAETLVRLLKDGSFPLAVPGLAQLHEMITGPAERAGLSFEDGLVARVLDDTGTEPGNLALMAFALAELYDAQQSGRMTLAAYETFGGVQGVITKTANYTFATLDADQKAALPDVFRELVEVDERGVPTRRHALQSEVCRSKAAEQFVDRFANARLLVTSQEGPTSPATGQGTVEVAHEALLKSWPKLSAWIETMRDELRLRSQLQRAAVDWREHKYLTSYRWSDERALEAAQMIRDLPYEPSDLEKKFLGPIDRDRMLETLRDPKTSHENRATIGVRLALLRDTRPGVGVNGCLPDIVWCPISAGQVSLTNVDAPFDVDAFRIAKYPVTYAQYQLFVDAKDGYREPQWWRGLAKRYYEEPGRQIPLLPNHPAVNVDWTEAVAYCRWLSQQVNLTVRLPTEWEWQQAAANGNRSFEYPWGPEWEEMRGNTYENRLNRTLAVGLYAQDTADDQPLDLAGNIWEWCLNEYARPVTVKQIKLIGKGTRAIRGGAGSSPHEYARASYRNHYRPDYRFDALGFRLVCVNPI